jgi:hypothetical protein
MYYNELPFLQKLLVIAISAMLCMSVYYVANVQSSY